MCPAVSPGRLDGAVCSAPAACCVLAALGAAPERRKRALAAQQVPGCCSLRSGFAVPLVLYSVSELLCSPGVVKTVNTGVTQRINGNDMRVVLMDNQYFPPPPAPLGWKTQCLRAAANKHLCWTWAWLCSGAVSPCPPPLPVLFLARRSWDELCWSSTPVLWLVPPGVCPTLDPAHPRPYASQGG